MDSTLETSSLEAVIFDLDGTLADTILDLGAAVNSVLERHGLPLHPSADYRRMVGRGFSLLMQQALPGHLVSDPERFSELAAEAAREYSLHALDTTKPFPGIAELLDRLAASRILMAVLSNKPDAMTKSMVSALFPGIPFIEVSGDREGIPRKPDPAAARAIAQKSGIPARRWAFVGDSGVDMATGKAAGMLPVGVAWGYRNREELHSEGAAALIESPDELPAMLEILGRLARSPSGGEL
jgi:phosphoglycolate phosphatase